MSLKRIILLLLFLFISFPLVSFVYWYFTPSFKTNITIIDKTVLNEKCDEHKSLNWVLNYKKYCKPNGELYSLSADYFGFFPKENKKYVIAGLEQLDTLSLDSLAEKSDMVYFTDTYGIYYKEWDLQASQTEHSEIIYGGLSDHDLYFLKKLKSPNKLIITEFNDFASPTDSIHRAAFENMFGLKWTGWIGRYFETFDTIRNIEIPHWLKNNYLNQHNKQWPFKNSGIAFVRDDGHIEILENYTHLTYEVPVIRTLPQFQEYYNLPAEMKYPFWFDITYASHANTIVSYFSILTNQKGDSILNAYNIPKDFPCVIQHLDSAYNFFYFAGDFDDNPIAMLTSYLKGFQFFKHAFYSGDNIAERKSFFWEYYRPLMIKILDDHYSKQ